MAVIYNDAYTLFGPDEGRQSPQLLETVVAWAIADDKPCPLSVERAIRQVYSDLHHWFYRTAREDVKGAIRFYRRRIRKAVPILETEEWRLELRRDLIWLLGGEDMAPKAPQYIDAFDYVSWALKHEYVPGTLVGRSHGDLHGRNILVGVQRGEAEFPAVFDYGEMGDANVLVWDFVKLETELKVRFLLPLFSDEAALNALVHAVKNEAPQEFSYKMSKPSAGRSLRALRVPRLRFAFLFELLLDEAWSQIHTLEGLEAACPPQKRNITGNTKLDNALGILLRIRQEATLLLSGLHTERRGQEFWKDEYNFALAVYGLTTSKFGYLEHETEFALVSAGVAAAHMAMARNAIRELAEPGPPRRTRAVRHDSHSYPSYHVPLSRAHELWKKQTTPRMIHHAFEILDPAVKYYSHAVPLIQEYALVLAEMERFNQAKSVLDPLKDLCQVFGDYETLCRIGRTCKNVGDIAWRRAPTPVTELRHHPAWQHYNAALKRYEEAFALRKNYYPGINAATLAYLVQKKTLSTKFANEVMKTCLAIETASLPDEEAFWVFATEGEGSLLLGRRDKATDFYKEALAQLDNKQPGMAQSAYDQLCRLWWAMGETAVGPIVAVFQKSTLWSHIKPGPLGNCGLDKRMARPKRTSRRRNSPRRTVAGRQKR